MMKNVTRTGRKKLKNVLQVVPTNLNGQIIYVMNDLQSLILSISKI